MFEDQLLETQADRKARRIAVEEITASELPVSEEAISQNIRQKKAREAEAGKIVPGHGHVDVRSLCRLTKGLHFTQEFAKLGQGSWKRNARRKNNLWNLPNVSGQTRLAGVAAPLLRLLPRL